MRLSTRRSVSGALAALAGALALRPCAVGAETQLLAGKRLAIRQSPKGERLVVVSRDALVAPLPGGNEDPTLLGATFEIGNPRTGEWVRFTIPAAGWTLNGLGTVFRYEGRRPHVAPGGVRELVIRHGKRLKLSATAAGVTLDEAAQGGLAVVLTTGSRRYCMLFGGSAVKRDEPRRFAARNAPAPEACPAPPVGTSTTTSTSTSIPRRVSSTTRAPQASTSTSTSSTIGGTAPPTTSTTSSTSSTSSTTRPPTTTTSTAQPPTTITTTTSTSTSSTSSATSSSATSSTATSTSSTTSSTDYTCGGFAVFCGGTCPPGATCVGGLITACRCEVLGNEQ